MDKKIIEKIFTENNLGEVKSIKKIEVGFTNKVYSVNEDFILKVCEDEENEENFEKEVFFYDFFKDKIPVPKVIFYDNSKQIYNKFFIVYPKIQGNNLYAKWHLMTDDERKNIIKQLCEFLKIINNADYKKFVEKFKISNPINWKESIESKIQKSLQELETREILSKEFAQKIQTFVEENKLALDEQKISLVYWDAHFDNILVKNNEIVGILDFERTELASIDFVLDILKRMMNYPKKYMSEESEKFAKKEDYENLLDWFQEFYPELFDFKKLEKRLDLYCIEHDLKDLIGWPNVIELKQQLATIVKYDGPTF
ncbi:aminoglycoside phosphotransferase family protein [Candidatus Nomurabacteria bacterium]|nr:aminoglycoside phosphotransferase family protein [Candidatus Nomurabacteria bacterium]